MEHRRPCGSRKERKSFEMRMDLSPILAYLTRRKQSPKAPAYLTVSFVRIRRTRSPTRKVRVARMRLTRTFGTRKLARKAQEVANRLQTVNIRTLVQKALAALSQAEKSNWSKLLKMELAVPSFGGRKLANKPCNRSTKISIIYEYIPQKPSVHSLVPSHG